MKKRTPWLIASLLACFVLAANVALAADFTPTDLSCEYLKNPEGIDVAAPRLTWILQPTDPAKQDLKQSAYQVLVASSAEKLAADEGDLWDSGKVASDRSVHVPYAGKTLESYTPCYWKVRTWDQDGQVSPWSPSAYWSMGILKPDQWQGEWIRFTGDSKEKTPPTAPMVSLKRMPWVWYPGEDANKSAPIGKRYFRRVLDIDGNKDLSYCGLAITADDQWTLFVNGKEVAKSDGKTYAWKRPKAVDLRPFLKPGKNVVAVEAENLEEGPAGLLTYMVILYRNPWERSEIPGNSGWKVSQEAKPGWNAMDFDESGWKSVQTLGHNGTIDVAGCGPWGSVDVPEMGDWIHKLPAPQFRKEFAVKKPLRRATAYVTGLGYYELKLNGAKVGNRKLDPAFTPYNRRVLYATYDVTDQVKQGENAVGMLLGNGWYNMHTRAVWDFDRAPWRDWPVARLNLRLEYADGTVETIVTDGSWKAGYGPLLRDSVRQGEVYDARQETPGWSRAGFDDAAWKPVEVAAGPEGVLRSEMIDPIRITESIRPVKIYEPKPGVFVFDAGQNMAGWAQLRTKGPAGTKVTMRYSERIHEDGSLDRNAIACHQRSEPFQTDVYILKGEGVETWEPRFAYHGFRYVEVTGLAEKPTLETITAKVVHTDFSTAGSFVCSDPMVNQLQKMNLWAYRSNFHGYPTDCPHREKNGWTADAHLAAEQAMYNFDNSPGYLKWVNDLEDTQRPNGMLPGIVPTAGWGFHWGNGPAWDSAYVLIPWYLYLYRHDLRVLEEHYDGIRSYIDYVSSRSPDHLANFGLNDWVPVKTQTPTIITSTAYFYVDTRILAKAAQLLGKEEDAKKYTKLADDTREAFQKKFYQGEGRYSIAGQTTLACALYQEMCPGSERAAIAERLAENIKANNDHLDVGVLGARYLFHALSENGHHELAYKVAMQPEGPSYGEWVKSGSTSLWEDWKGHDSINHAFFGDISAWFYQKLAGINPDMEQPGFKKVVLRPLPLKELTWVRAEHLSQYGPIKSAWKKQDGQFTWTVTVPVNTTATVYVPSTKSDTVVEASGKKSVRREGDAEVFELGSGQYEFTVSTR